MARYSFILTEENREKLIVESLNIEAVRLDKKIIFDDYARFYRSSVNSLVIPDIGAFSYSRTGANLLRIGNYCSIDGGVSIMGENHPYERFTTHTITYQKNGGILSAVVDDRIMKVAFVQNPDKHAAKVRLKRFRIGSDVHIRANCVLANNLVLSTGCCVEEASVVVKDVPPYAIVAGNPA
ncbi:MAG: hypothetical protein J5680_07740, partial [Neisseriaceae bacterium]|nr:hypothetical protein [Neisseriaceae bacterium]